jgi:GMP synthase (glutamine-hydrolysing)
MTHRVVLVKHADRPNDDLASVRLAELGYELDIRHPHAGEKLGEPDETVAATLLYGGPDPADPRDWHSDRFPFIAMESRWVEACMARDIPTLPRG